MTRSVRSVHGAANAFNDTAVGVQFDTAIRGNNNQVGDEYDGVGQEAQTPTEGTPTPTDTATPGFVIAVSLIVWKPECVDEQRDRFDALV